MWSTEDDVILSAASYYIDAQVSNKTKTLLKPTSLDPPKFKLSENDHYSRNCGKIFITINQLLVFHCTFCNSKYGTLFNFLQHISAKHLHVKKYVQSNITARKKIVNKNTPFTKMEPVQKYLPVENGIVKNKTSPNKRAKKKPVPGKTKIGKNSVKSKGNQSSDIANKIDYSAKKTLITELETVHPYLSLEVASKTVDHKQSSSRRTKKKLVEKTKKTAKQGDKAGKAKLEKTEEFGDVETEIEYHDKISISSMEDIERNSLLKNAKNHKCTICETTFALKGNLRKHLLRHTNEKNYSCDLCDKRFFSRTEVAVHKRIHTGERPYVCFKCGNSFKTASSFSRHMRRHTNIRTKKCDVCEKAFLDNFGLRNHMVGHSNERPFVCSYCSLSFARKRTLTQHIKLHINARAYKCSICEKSFNQKPALLSHMNHNHKLLES